MTQFPTHPATLRRAVFRALVATSLLAGLAAFPALADAHEGHGKTGHADHDPADHDATDHDAADHDTTDHGHVHHDHARHEGHNHGADSHGHPVHEGHHHAKHEGHEHADHAGHDHSSHDHAAHAGHGLDAASDSDSDGLFPYPVRHRTLDNGLEAYVVPMPSEGLVAYWTIVRTGARDEFEEGRTGFAHFFEHMMFRGTERFPADVYNRSITAIGADANAFTTDDLTAYHLAIAAEDLERVMDLESDRFQNLSYSEEQFQTEAGAVFGEYRKARTNPAFVLYEAARKEMFREHTYGHTALGYVEDIQRMPQLYDYSRDFFSRYYRPDNTILLIVGDVDADATLAAAERYYGPWERGYVAPTIPVEPDQTAERSIRVPYEGSTLPWLWLSYRGAAFDPNDRLQAALSIFTQLAFGETSEAYRQLVLEDQSVEFVSAETSMNRDPSSIDIYTRVKDPANVDAVREQIEATIERFQTELPSREAVDAVKSNIRYDFLMNLDTPSAVASGMARLLAVTGRFDSVEEMLRTLEAVEPEDVREAARTYLKTQRRTVAVLEGAS